jgi:hypothetical protein
MPSSTPPYHSYLLRLWLAGDDEHPQWRTALIDPQTGASHGFASLEALTTFLKAKMVELLTDRIQLVDGKEKEK